MGFTSSQTCSQQTAEHDLGGCRMCCTAMERCTIATYGSTQSVIQAAHVEAEACRGECLSDKP